MHHLGLSELVLIVRDVPVAARFYRDVVGLIPETEPTADWAWFWLGQPGPDAFGRQQRLALHAGPLLFEEHSPNPPGRRWGQVHFALQVPRDRLPEAIRQVQAHGFQTHGPTQLGWMRAEAYYFYDPDGNLVEFWSPSPS
jgi:catechol 2,3-dioxygenase-like lactoylglutathione lyase family enzyme